MMESLETISLAVANASSSVEVMQEYVSPLLRTFGALAGTVASLVLVFAGYLYMTSSGRPDELAKAKRLARSALVGLVVVIGAAVIVGVMVGSYGEPAGGKAASLPRLEALEASEVDNGLVDVLIKAVTGFLSTIIQAVATPFLSGLNYFTSGTPLMVENPSVFNLWLVILGIANVLLVLVMVLIGFQIMSAGMFGFEEVSVRQMLPRVGLVFLLMNSSIFVIDGVIRLSNVLITALRSVAGADSPWETLTLVVESTSGQGVAALLLMLVFLIFTVFLLVYYVMRLVTLFIGAVLSPLVLMVWLVPGFRDFSETAVKTYVTTIFVLFVHVVILLLAASLFTGMASIGPNQLPDTLMSLVVGLATIVVLLKTQGVMTQFSFVSMGARNARTLGGQFVNGVSYLGARGGSTLSRVGGAAGSGLAYGTGRFRGAPAMAGASTASSSPSLSSPGASLGVGGASSGVAKFNAAQAATGPRLAAGQREDSSTKGKMGGKSSSLASVKSEAKSKASSSSVNRKGVRK